MILLSKDQMQKTRRLLLITGVLVTFAFWFPLEDPINLPKMFVLMAFTAWISATTFVSFWYQRSKSLALGEWALGAFALGILLAAVLTDVRFTAFFGASHRNNGALSYLALAALAFSAMNTFDIKSIHQVRYTLFFVGALLTAYGLLQTTGHDPFNWNNLYNSVFGTVGNPDFLSGLVGVLAIASAWLLLIETQLWLRISGVVLLLLELFIIKRSGSVQGLLAFAIGAAILLLLKIWQIHKRAGMISLAVALLGGLLVFLGLLNKGPIAAIVYRASFQSRKDYWDAAMEMFKAHPLTGVGLERFAENYLQFAPQIQVVQGQSTDNAHNVILQLLATGGLLVILPYLFLLAVIFWTALRAIKSSSGREQIEITALFSIWFALSLISFISIDNLGVTIWYWLLGGALYAITRPRGSETVLPMREKKSKGKSARQSTQDNSAYVAPIASLLLTIVALTLMVPIIRTSGAIYRLSGNSDGLAKEQYVARLNEVANSFPKNSQTLTLLADLSLRVSVPEQALKFASMILEKDQKSQSGNVLSASAYEQLKKFELAIPYRLRVIELNPWNTPSRLNLVKDYLALNDRESAQAMTDELARLNPLAGDSVEAANLMKG
ncbi:MAG: O-antigen ligase family protein [Candidatus Nanopelagicaceae bacterium]|nr:O-antigen ligase family protein [Candidatus Nanopelagicaceae bacterium]